MMMMTHWMFSCSVFLMVCLKEQEWFVVTWIVQLDNQWLVQLRVLVIHRFQKLGFVRQVQHCVLCNLGNIHISPCAPQARFVNDAQWSYKPLLCSSCSTLPVDFPCSSRLLPLIGHTAEIWISLAGDPGFQCPIYHACFFTSVSPTCFEHIESGIHRFWFCHTLNAGQRTLEVIGLCPLQHPYQNIALFP